MLFKKSNAENLKYFILDFIFYICLLFNDLNIYCEDVLHARHFGKCFVYGIVYDSVKDTVN